MRASERDRADSLPAGDSPQVEGVSDCLAPRLPAGRQVHVRPPDQPGPAHFFDLEDPVSLARLAAPMSALQPLKGLVVLHEVQRMPELFPLLRVLADRKPLPYIRRWRW